MQYKQLFEGLMDHIAEGERVQFTSLFALIDFLNTKHELNNQCRYILHKFRKLSSEQLSVTHLDLAECAIDIVLEHILDLPPTFGQSVNAVYYRHRTHGDHEIAKFKYEEKVYLLKIDMTKKLLVCRTVDEPFEERIVSFGRSDRNEDFQYLFSQLEQKNLCPLFVQLIDIEVSKNDQIYFPAIFVFEPDYLYDVTAVSECFGAFINQHLSYLINKFQAREVTNAILIGNIANYFLDQLIYHPNLSFQEVVKGIFKLDPLSFARITDEQLSIIIEKLKVHFQNIKNAIHTLLTSVSFDSKTSYIEPSFYSAKYGIQGRLDLLSMKDQKASIIELKSGKPYKTNTYGLNNSHYHQTLLYDLLIESAYGKQIKRQNFILYSQVGDKNLRYAPSIRSEQREAIKMRNLMLIADKEIQAKRSIISLIDEWKKYYGDNIKGFLLTNTNYILETFGELDDLTKKYCERLFQFVYTELSISKTGTLLNQNMGLSSLWNVDIADKKLNFNILNHLSIAEDKSMEDDALVKLERSDKTAKLSNFRVGDIGVLYPELGNAQSVLHHQIFKCSLLEIDDHTITIRLRCKQQNPNLFSDYTYWHIEHDVLENGYNAMISSIFEFACAPKSYRDLILSRKPAKTNATQIHACGAHLTYEQAAIFNEAISAKDYYLLWGPPGTGKTSMMLKEFAAHYRYKTNERILLLAYTNRAVDEICDALLTIEPVPDFIRIGSRYSTAAHIQPFLLENKIEPIQTREELKSLLILERIYVATVASILNKDSLFKIVDFDICIVDEASQILEASLIGLLSRVKKFILIGDHKQLPSVVQQSPQASAVDDDELEKSGIVNFNNSLFERLYKQAKNKSWHHVIGQLSFQGRMHKDLMAYSNRFWYENKLKILENEARLSSESIVIYDAHLNTPLTQQRFIYCPTDIDVSHESIKINQHEVAHIIRLVKSIIVHVKQKSFTSKTIGIITPYRSQIAAIQAALDIEKIAYKDMITVDTVERYQGGARDIIILSCTLNYLFQLKSLCSLSSDGLDRKLNVAFTRAREQFILVGNKDILSQNYLYRALINNSFELIQND